MQSHQKILTQEEFDYSTSRAGDLVEEAVVDDAMDCVPPG